MDRAKGYEKYEWRPDGLSFRKTVPSEKPLLPLLSPPAVLRALED
jgi:hypothetical protein